MTVARPCLLFVAHLLPWPLEGGGQIKSYYTLRALASVFDVRLVAFIRSEAEREHIAPLLSLCTLGVETVLLQRSRARDAALALGGLAGHQSFLVRRDDNPAMRTLVDREARAGQFRALHFDHLQMMQFAPYTGSGVPPVVLDNHNAEYQIPKRLAETANNPMVRAFARREWPRLQSFERWAVQRADITLAVSDEDAQTLARLAPERIDHIATVPIGVDTDYFRPVNRKPDASDLLSIGTMFWPPNVDAVTWLHRDIWPTIKKTHPNTKFMIVGARPTRTVRALAQQDASVVVTGTVPDVRPFGEECAAFVVPLRSGSGMRVKILNALAMGLPVVSTPVGAEGIAVTHQENILLAETPDEFAHACLRLLADKELGDRLGQAGRLLVEARYGWEAVGKTLLSVYERHILAALPGARP